MMADTSRRRRATCHALVVLVAVVVTWAGAPTVHATPPSSARVLDSFDDLTPWNSVASDDVHASIHRAAGKAGRALRLDFDLNGTAGFAAARRALPLTLPPRYELSFYLRADAPVNAFQVKLIDASGDNVWWVNRPNYQFPRQWQRVTIKQRQIEFAWGPTHDRTLRHAAILELVVAAGRGGGRGSVYISQLVLRELPAVPMVAAPPVVTASSFLRGADASRAIDGDVATAWRSDPAAGAAQDLTVDFRHVRELGGLVLRWEEGAYASRYDVQLSDDGVRWRTVRRIIGGTGRPHAVLLPDAETRFLRLALREGPSRGYGVAELEIKDAAFGATPNAFFQALARESPRGTYPRGFSGEQPSWTLVGVDGGRESGLLSSDGALEVARGGFSIEPFIVSDGRVVTWADAEVRQSLLDDDLPIPVVTWRSPRWELRVSAFATGSRDRSQLVARYEVKNLTGQTVPIQLVLATRPFQVNPPAQFLNDAGGVSPIHHVKWDGATLTVNGNRRVFPLRTPDRAGAFALDAGPVPSLLTARPWRGRDEVRDEAGYASAALVYQLTLPPRDSRTLGLVVPLSGAPAAPNLDGKSPATWIDDAQAVVAAAWRERLDRVWVDVPAAGQPLIATLRTALAHILMSRDGPVLRPGTRAYARSWIRDGAMIAESLLRVGHPAVAADYLRWYAPHQFASGKVPCCIDERGADPVAENDSPGELIFLAAEIYRYTRDRALLEETWPHVAAAARYLETLRQSERTDANLTPARRGFFGLLPASISHEGYAAKPMHSYWDNFWGLKGYDGALAIATALGHTDAASQLARQRDEFRGDVLASLQQVTTAHGIAYLPGAAELGDFDPASSTIAIAPGGALHQLPSDLVRATFERYWREFVDRRDGRTTWDDYTPYEIRTVGTFVRLGWHERAHELLTFFLADRRPIAWNQWPEVIGRDARPRFVGDLPHAWVASDFIRAALDLFAYEREADGAVVLGAGIPAEWFEGRGVRVRGLRTPYGPLSYSIRKDGETVVLEVAEGLRMPPGGVVFAWPGTQPPRATRLNGNAVHWNGTELRIDAVPAKVVMEE